MANPSASFEVELSNGSPPMRGEGREVITRARTLTEAMMDTVVKPHRSVTKILEAPPQAASTFGATVFLATKQMVGSGILAMGDGFKFASIGPGLLAFGGIAAISVTTMLVVADLSEKHRVTSYPELWAQVIGRKSSRIVELATFLNTVLSCIAYVLLIGKWLTQSLTSIFGDAFSSRTLNSWIVAIPLAFMVLQKDLSVFRFSSLAGLGCMCFGLGFLLWQTVLHWQDDDIASRTCLLTPSANSTSSDVLREHMWQPSTKVLEIVCVGSSMMMVHYNIPKLRSEYDDNNALSFRAAIMTSVFLAFCFATVLGLATLLRFGTSMPKGNALNHFGRQLPGSKEAIMNVGEQYATYFTWIVMVFGIVASVPIAFLPMRTCFLRLCRACIPGIPPLESMSPSAYMGVTFALVATVTFIGTSVETLTALSTFKGEFCGMSIALVFPFLLKYYDASPPRPLQADAYASVGFDLVGFLGIFLVSRGVLKIFGLL